MQQTRQQTGGRAKATLFLVGALLIAGITSYLVWRVVENMRTELAKAKEGPERVRVLVAARDIYMGETISEGDLQTFPMLPDMIYPELVFTEEQMQQLLNRTAKERILAGEVLREERLADANAGVGLNALIPRGMRAMTIDVDPQSSLGGLLQPGNRVDVIVTIRPDDRNAAAKWVTETILQDKRVLAVGARLKPVTAAEKDEEAKKGGRSRRERPSVTLELSLEDSEKLALAASRGDMHLVLRSDVDNTQQETEGALTTNEMMGLQAAAAAQSSGRRSSGRAPTPAPVDPNRSTAEVIEGSTSTSVQFDANGNKIEPSSAGRRR